MKEEDIFKKDNMAKVLNSKFQLVPIFTSNASNEHIQFT